MNLEGVVRIVGPPVDLVPSSRAGHRIVETGSVPSGDDLEAAGEGRDRQGHGRVLVQVPAVKLNRLRDDREEGGARFLGTAEGLTVGRGLTRPAPDRQNESLCSGGPASRHICSFHVPDSWSLRPSLTLMHGRPLPRQEIGHLDRQLPVLQPGHTW